MPVCYELGKFIKHQSLLFTERILITPYHSHLSRTHIRVAFNYVIIGAVGGAHHLHLVLLQRAADFQHDDTGIAQRPLPLVIK